MRGNIQMLRLDIVLACFSCALVVFRSKTQTLENQTKQIVQLKNYIGESETIPRPIEIWRKEKETLENRLKVWLADTLPCNIANSYFKLFCNSNVGFMSSLELFKSSFNKPHDMNLWNKFFVNDFRYLR